MVKNLPAMQETRVQSLGWENPLEKGKATHSSILAWRIPWTVQFTGSPEIYCYELMMCIVAPRTATKKITQEVQLESYQSVKIAFKNYLHKPKDINKGKEK